jgi:ABC-2 type transport system ATP-binding protein
VSASVEPSGLAPLLEALTAAGVRTLTSQPPSLEELFLRHYGTPDDDGPGDGPGHGADKASEAGTDDREAARHA